MKRLEISFVFLSILGIIMSFMLIPGGTLLYVFGCTILMFMYLLFGAPHFNGLGFRQMIKKENWKGINGAKVFAGIIVGFAASAGVLTIIYKLTMWPGADQINMSTIPILILAIIAAFIMSRDDERKFFKRAMPRLLPLLALVTILQSVSREDVLEYKFRNHPYYIEAMKNLWENPSDPDAMKEFDEAIVRMTLGEDEYNRRQAEDE